jgi:hypothetical protein
MGESRLPAWQPASWLYFPTRAGTSPTAPWDGGMVPTRSRLDWILVAIPGVVGIRSAATHRGASMTPSPRTRAARGSPRATGGHGAPRLPPTIRLTHNGQPKCIKSTCLIACATRTPPRCGMDFRWSAPRSADRAADPRYTAACSPRRARRQRSGRHRSGTGSGRGSPGRDGIAPV